MRNPPTNSCISEAFHQVKFHSDTSKGEGMVPDIGYILWVFPWL